MRDKAFFQLIAFISFVTGIVFLFDRDPDRWEKVGICGAVFALATVVSLAAGRRRGDAADA